MLNLVGVLPASPPDQVAADGDLPDLRLRRGGDAEPGPDQHVHARDPDEPAVRGSVLLAWLHDRRKARREAEAGFGSWTTTRSRRWTSAVQPIDDLDPIDPPAAPLPALTPLPATVPAWRDGGVAGEPAGRARSGGAAGRAGPGGAGRAPGCEVVVLAGESGAESAALASDAVGSGVDAVVAVGGDGLVHCAVQARRRHRRAAGHRARRRRQRPGRHPRHPGRPGRRGRGGRGRADPGRRPRPDRPRDLVGRRAQRRLRLAGGGPGRADAPAARAASATTWPPTWRSRTCAQHRMRITLDGVSPGGGHAGRGRQQPRYGGGMHIAPGADLDRRRVRRGGRRRDDPGHAGPAQAPGPRRHARAAPQVTSTGPRRSRWTRPTCPRTRTASRSACFRVTTTCVPAAIRVLVPERVPYGRVRARIESVNVGAPRPYRGQGPAERHRQDARSPGRSPSPCPAGAPAAWPATRSRQAQPRRPRPGRLRVRPRGPRGLGGQARPAAAGRVFGENLTTVGLDVTGAVCRRAVAGRDRWCCR